MRAGRKRLVLALQLGHDLDDVLVLLIVQSAGESQELGRFKCVLGSICGWARAASQTMQQEVSNCMMLED